MKLFSGMLLLLSTASLVACGSSNTGSHELSKDELKAANDKIRIAQNRDSLAKMDQVVFDKIIQPEKPNFESMSIEMQKQDDGSYRYEIRLRPKNDASRMLDGVVIPSSDSSDSFAFSLDTHATASDLTKQGEKTPSCVMIEIKDYQTFFKDSGVPESPIILCK